MTFGFKEYLLIGIFLLSALALWKSYHAGEKAASAKIESSSLLTASKVREKENEIRNHKPDQPALVGRLRSHTY